MFWTLIIQLPNIHEGSELVIHKNDSITLVHDFGGKKSLYSIHFAAHYADVDHEILKVIMLGGWKWKL